MGVTDNKIPSLDGLRAISVAIVILGHLVGTGGYPKHPVAQYFGFHASLGVTVFFVISGYLITTLLINERAKHGSISISMFYVRRALRILPAFFLFMLGLMAADYVGLIQLTWLDYLTSFTYTVNFNPKPDWNVGHLWSLSVEEQFYLLWPAAIALLGAPRSLSLAIVVFMGAPATRATMHLLISSGPLRDLPIFPAVADSIAIGAIFAMIRPQLLANQSYQAMTASNWILLLVPAIFVANGLRNYTIADLTLSPLIVVSIAVLVEASTRRADSSVGRLLNSKLFVFIGSISYSLYLWQQPFLHRKVAAWYTTFPQNLLLALTLACASYWLLEKPFMKLRKSWTRDERERRVPRTTPSAEG